MDKSKRARTIMMHDATQPETPPRWQVALMAALLLVILVGNVLLTYQVFTSQFPGLNDFLSRWEGARTFFQDGDSPYSDSANLNIQTMIYGRAAEGTEDPGYFVYPFYTVFVVGALTPLDYAWASALWMVILEVCLVVGMLLLINFYPWKPPVWLLPLLIFYALFDYYAARGLFLGQPSHVVYLLQMIVVWALWREQNALAGVALAFSTFKPQMGYLFVPFVLIAATVYGRRRLMIAFALTFAVLMGASFLLQPDWFGAWLDQVRRYPDYTAAAYPDTGSPVWIITQHYLKAGAVVEWAVNLLLLAPVAWGIYTVFAQKKHERLLWALALTTLAANLVALRTATPHFVVFNLIWVFYFKQMHERWGAWTVGLLVVALMVSGWVLFGVSVQGRNSLEHPVMFLLTSFGLYALVLMTRRLWWETVPDALA